MSAREVLLHADFEAETGREEWIPSLLSEIEQLVEMLTEFPSAGVVVGQEGTESLRRLLLPRSPFVVWYVFDPASNRPVWVLRLFHFRQRTVRPGAIMARVRRKK